MDTYEKLSKLNKKLYRQIVEFIKKEKISISEFSIKYQESEFTVNIEKEDGYLESTMGFSNDKFLSEIE